MYYPRQGTHAQNGGGFKISNQKLISSLIVKRRLDVWTWVAYIKNRFSTFPFLSPKELTAPRYKRYKCRKF